jgi:hypothetical protein
MLDAGIEPGFESEAWPRSVCCESARPHRPHIDHAHVAEKLKKENQTVYLIAHGDWTP